MKKIIIGIVAVVLIIVGISYFSKNSSQPTFKETIKIGVILPLTGDLSSFGEGSKIATELAVKEINNSGGVNNRKIETIFEDSKCSNISAVSAVQKLINLDKVSAIIGEICSSATLAVAPIVEKNKTPLVSPCSSAPDITNAGDYIFRTYPSDFFEGKVVAEYTKNKLGYSKVAILYVNNDWGNGLKKVFKENLTKLNGNIAIEESYQQGNKDLRTQLTKIKSINPESIYFIGYIDEAVVVLKQIKEMKINVPIFGNSSWSESKLISEAGNASEGVYWIELKSSTPPVFLEKEMELKRGNKEIPVCSIQYYDAVKLLAKSINGLTDISGNNIKDKLYQTTLSGLSGEISFDKNGDLVNAEYSVKIIKNGKAELLK